MCCCYILYRDKRYGIIAVFIVKYVVSCAVVIRCIASIDVVLNPSNHIYLFQ